MAVMIEDRDRLFMPTPFQIRISKGLIVFCSLALLGLGCRSQGPTTTLSTFSPTSSSTLGQDIAINPAFDDPEGYVLLQGKLFSDATTTLSLRQSPDRYRPRTITGRYSEEGTKNLGLMIGTYPERDDWDHLTFRIKPLEAYFHEGDGVQTVTGAWASGGKEFVGTIQGVSEAKPRSFVLRVVSQTDIPKSAEIKFRRIRETWSSSPWVDVCEYGVEYPEVTSPQSERMNKIIQNTLLERGMTTLQEQVQTYIRACLPGTWPVNGSGNQSHLIATEIGMNERNILSFFFYSEDWEGGAHQTMKSKAVSFDLTTGKRITFSDLIAPEHLHDFIKYEGKKTLEAEYANFQQAVPPIQDRETFDQLPDFDDLKTFVAATSTLSISEQVRRYGDLKNFYLTPKGLVIFYNSYDLGMWANTPHVLLPYDEWKSFARVNALTQRMMMP